MLYPSENTSNGRRSKSHYSAESFKSLSEIVSLCRFSISPSHICLITISLLSKDQFFNSITPFSSCLCSILVAGLRSSLDCLQAKLVVRDKAVCSIIWCKMHPNTHTFHSLSAEQIVCVVVLLLYQFSHPISPLQIASCLSVSLPNCLPYLHESIAIAVQIALDPQSGSRDFLRLQNNCKHDWTAELINL